MHGFHISIEGNIAVVKSTLIEQLGNRLKNHGIGVLTAAEPMDRLASKRKTTKSIESAIFKSPEIRHVFSKIEQLVNIPDTTCLLT